MDAASVCCVCCCEEVSTEDLITCSYCHYGTCEDCASTYILGKLSEPSCMSCRKVWSREFVMEHFDGTWLRESFFDHLGRLLMEQEKGLLPATQDEAKAIATIRSLSAEVRCLPTNEALKRRYKSDKDMYELRLGEKRCLRDTLLSKIASIKKQTITYGYGPSRPGFGSASGSASQPKYIFKCPFLDCRGFINTNYTCGTCAKKVCDRCHACLDDDPKAAKDHKCNKDDIQSAQTVMRETKPCPKCMTLIFKASGCNQMYCTQCHVAFDWVTCTIDTGVIHNPHFFEYIASHQGQADINMERIACGDLPDPYVFMAHVRVLGIERQLRLGFIHGAFHPNNMRTVFMQAYQHAVHIREIVITMYTVDRVKDNLDLRVQYLLAEIDEPTWMARLLSRERKRMKFKAFNDLSRMTMVVLEDMVRQIMATSPEDHHKMDTIVDSIKNLREYYTNALDNINMIHGGRTPPTMEFWT